MSLTPLRAGKPPSRVSGALVRSRSGLLAVGLFSSVINVLALAGSIYMLQIYDRVLTSRSIETLIGLTIIMLLLYAGFGVLDVLRTRMMTRVGVRLERGLRDRVFGAVAALPLLGRQGGDGQQPIRDLDQIRGFLSGQGPTALFDLPWIPFYLAFVFLLHPWLGLLGLAGALVLVGLTILTELSSKPAIIAATLALATRNSAAESVRRNADVVRALGMSSRVTRRYATASEAALSHSIAATDAANGYGATTRVVRMLLQSAVLGLGAYLTIMGQATAGVMIAASILVSRALAPVEIAIGNWRSFVAARQGTTRLDHILAVVPVGSVRTTLPPPGRELSAEGLWVTAPGSERMILHNVTLTLKAGDGVGIIGPSASGKSTLARSLVGAWAPKRGSVRLDAAALEQWPADALGRHIGYLPQVVELFDGTVAQNIARLDPEASSQAVIQAAKQAGVHDLIVRLPHGYETEVGEGGAALSAGQRQRIALARALFGDPFLVVLDEPNSNLDAEGDAALTQAVTSVRRRGGIVVVIAHRPSALAGLDLLCVLSAGQVQAFGSKDDVLRKTVQSVTPPSAPTGHLMVIGDSHPGGGNG